MDEKDRKNEQWQGEERRQQSQGNFKGDERRKGGNNQDQHAQDDGLEEG